MTNIARISLVSIGLLLCMAGCTAQRSTPAANTVAPAGSSDNIGPSSNAGSNAGGDSAAGAAGQPERSAEPANKPGNVREFFMALPVKYFPLEGCEPAKDKGCVKAKAEYLKTFLETEDTANGYLKAGCDGAQSCLEMAIFKKPDGSYIVGVRGDFEMGSDTYFVDYDNGKWTDVGSSIVEGFSTNNYYAIPRKGTTVEVFEKLPEDAEPVSDSPKGKKLYDLEWSGGRFNRKK